MFLNAVIPPKGGTQFLRKQKPASQTLNSVLRALRAPHLLRSRCSHSFALGPALPRDDGSLETLYKIPTSVGMTVETNPAHWAGLLHHFGNGAQGTIARQLHNTNFLFHFFD